MYDQITSMKCMQSGFLSHKQAVSLNSFSLKAVFSMFERYSYFPLNYNYDF